MLRLGLPSTGLLARPTPVQLRCSLSQLGEVRLRLADTRGRRRALSDLLACSIHHRLADRVRAHLFVCLLAYLPGVAQARSARMPRSGLPTASRCAVPEYYTYSGLPVSET